MKTKEEVIKEAWGKNYEVFKEHIDKDGWARYPDFQKHEMVENVRPIEFRSQRTDFRPLKLQGIEDNNGWIRIESEEDLPKDCGDYWVYDDDGDFGYYMFNIFEDKDFEYVKENGITHYQPIIKPKPPLY